VWVNGAVVGSGFSSSWNVNGQGGGSEQMTLIDPTSSQKIYLVNGCLASGQDNLVTWNVNGITSGSVNVQGAGYPKQMVCVDPTTGHTYLIVNGCLAGDAPAGGDTFPFHLMHFLQGYLTTNCSISKPPNF
jgi:hypothetical protein